MVTLPFGECHDCSSRVLIPAIAPLEVKAHTFIAPIWINPIESAKRAPVTHPKVFPFRFPFPPHFLLQLFWAIRAWNPLSETPIVEPCFRIEADRGRAPTCRRACGRYICRKEPRQVSVFLAEETPVAIGLFTRQMFPFLHFSFNFSVKVMSIVHKTKPWNLRIFESNFLFLRPVKLQSLLPRPIWIVLSYSAEGFCGPLPKTLHDELTRESSRQFDCSDDYGWKPSIGNEIITLAKLLNIMSGVMKMFQPPMMM